jgi:hypothetical protein
LQWLDLTLPEHEQLVTPPARTFVVEELREQGAVQPMLAL